MPNVEEATPPIPPAPVPVNPVKPVLPKKPPIRWGPCTAPTFELPTVVAA